MPQHVTVAGYDPAWPALFRKEKGIVEDILGDCCLAVYHIGSTAVHGLAAKPVIDIMAAVKDLGLIDGKRDAFAAAGYQWLGEYGIAGRRYLRKGGDERTHQIHIFRGDDYSSIIRHIAFREYMARHEDAREEYGALKKELARKFPYDIGGYCDGKDAYVKRMEAKALAEYDDSWDRLYLSARMAQGCRMVSRYVEAGSVAASVISESGRIYSGVCLDTACSLGMCAERNAIGSMVTAGDSRVARMAVIMPDGSLGIPCGSCQELLMQLGCGDAEILQDYASRRVIALKSLVPQWWGNA